MEGALVSLVTEERQDLAPRPGEFLWWLKVDSGDDGTAQAEKCAF